MPSSYFKPLSLMLLAALLFGCGGPSRIHPPGIDADAAGPAAIQEYDTNKDGAIAGDELAKAGSIYQAFSRIDGAVEGSSPDQKVTAEEITARINQWKESRVGRMALQCTVKYRGMPLEGATVTFVPEKFLGENVQAANGTTDRNGTAVVRIPDVDPPGVAPGLYKVEISKQVGGQEQVPPQYNTQTILGQESRKRRNRHGNRNHLQPQVRHDAQISTNYSRRWRRVRFVRDFDWGRRNAPTWKHARRRSFSNMAAGSFWIVWPPPSRKTTDGKTPMRGHPVFIAQHATATCCRGCLAQVAPHRGG